jgi:crossover junction endodeoxyribonuclease RusA
VSHPWRSTNPHFRYGPCDAFGPGGSCSECAGRVAGEEFPPGFDKLNPTGTIHSFWVDGTPATKGSWRSYGPGRFVPDNTRERPWSNAVAWVAKASGIRPVDGPVHLTVECFYPRPKKPRHSFPSKNDCDKAARSVMDALSGVAYADDQQVVRLVATKAFAGDKGPGAWIRIEEVQP